MTITRSYTINKFPKSSKLFISFMLCTAGFCYLSLLAGIWNDTQMKLSLIIEAYSGMEAIELVEHSFKYLFWFLGVFTITGFLFMMGSCSEQLKRPVAVLVPVFIVLDVASAWLIRVHPFFAQVMVASGFFLALFFLGMFFLVQRELWWEKRQKRGMVRAPR